MCAELRQGRTVIPNERALPKSFLRRCLLLLLAENPTHGYELVESLVPFGFDGSDPGGVYRALRTLESDGFVSSSWHHSSSGPYRRVYELTTRGERELSHEAQDVAHAEAILVGFLDRYRCVCNGGRPEGNGNGHGNGVVRETRPGNVGSGR